MVFLNLVMGKINLKLSPGNLFPILFHVILWGIWIFLPIINAGDHERYRQISIALIPVSLTNIPLFLFNSEWLIPTVFRKKGIGVYLFSLLLLIAAFSVLQLFMKEWIIPPELMRRHWNWFWAVVPVCFVTAISTGYGFIVYLMQQENTKQEEQQEGLTSELSFLRSQISPHFIFNILNSIVYLIRSKSPQAESVTIQLSELMRYMLYTTADEQVSLEKEVNYLRNYIDLQKIRFEEDVEIHFNMEGGFQAQLIEPMLLIPFVENAFKHGVGMIAQPVIYIDLQFDQKQLIFIVRNKLASGQEEAKDESSGIGLKNVKRRLELLYPEQHQLHIKQEEEWFEVQLQLEFVSDKTLALEISKTQAL